MPKFFVKDNQVNNGKILVLGEDVNHIKNVLRLNIDDNIQVCNVDTKINYICGISKISEEAVETTIFSTVETNSEANIYINVFQGLPKADKMELIIQKAVELRSSRNYSSRNEKMCCQNRRKGKT